MSEVIRTEDNKNRRTQIRLFIVTLVIGALVFSNITIYLLLQNKITILAENNTRLIIEKENVENELDSVKLAYGNYVSDHSHTNAEYDQLESDYNEYAANHHYTDLQCDERQFFFYYDKQTEQKFGVYSLDEELEGLYWPRPYEEGVFDCSEMSASLERYLENRGWHTKIVIGESPFSSGRHAWLLVETSEGKYMPVESTNIQVVWWSNAYFDNYWKYDHSFETIQDALKYSESSFDWWDS